MQLCLVNYRVVTYGIVNLLLWCNVIGKTKTVLDLDKSSKEGIEKLGSEFLHSPTQIDQVLFRYIAHLKMLKYFRRQK